MSLIICGASGALALALGLALWLGPGNEPARAPLSQANGAAGQQEAPAPRPERKASENGQGNRGSGDQQPSPRPAPRPRGAETMADLVGVRDHTPAHVSTVTGKLTAARRAMWSRDLAAAHQHVDAADRQAQTPTERDETQRLGELLDALEAFWTAVRHGAERLEAADELHLGDRPVLVVEADAERLIIRDAGQNFTYPMQDLPSEVALALATRTTPQGHPTTNLWVGAFLAVDKRGDRQEARTRWQQAGEEGNALLPELALAPPPEPPQAEPKAPSPAVPGAMIDAPPQSPLPAPVDDPPVASPPVDRAPLPDAGTLGPAEKLVQELFQDDLEAARTPESKRALSRRLLDVARDTNDDPAACYVLCRIARDLAVEVGDPDAFCPVIDELDRRFEVDGLAMKAEAFNESWRSPTAAPYRPALAEQSLGLLSSAIQAKQYEAAQQFLRVAQYGARATKNYQLLRQLDEQARQINASLRSNP
jgi:hypothetical protein